MSQAGVAVLHGVVDSYACARCGAPTSFKPGSDSLACDHCSAIAPIVATRDPIPTYDVFGKTAIASLGAAELTRGGHEVSCKVCGARAISTRQAERCAFCDSPLVVEVDAGTRAIPPGALLPFAIDRATANARFRAWLESRWFAPRDLVKRAKSDAMAGVYLPYWTYDAATRTSYDGERGIHYYETETYTENGETKTREVQRTRWHAAAGTVEVDFTDVLVCASPALSRKLLERLEPWDLDALRGYDGRYLAGFAAERYRVEPADGFTTAYERMEPKIRSAICRDIGGDEQRISTMNVEYDRAGFRHLLLPLWLSAFRYDDRVFHVTVNARTGEVAGERPWSAAKIVLLVVAIAAIVAAIIILATHRR